MGTLKIEFEGNTWEFQPSQIITIGRHPTCTIVVSDPSVSRRHLTVECDQQTWTVTNTGSTGTYLDGRPIESLPLDSGTRLYLGSPDGTAIRFEPEPDASPASAAEDRTVTVSFNGEQATYTPGQVVVVGRDSDSTFVINEPTVSRRHLTIQNNGHEWVVQDTSSTGTYAGYERVSSMPIREPVTLCLGSNDGVQLGLWVATAPAAPRVGSIEELVDASSSVHTEFRALEQNVQAQGRTSPPWWLLLPFGAWMRSKRIRAWLPLFLLVVWIAPIAITAYFSNSETSLTTINNSHTVFPIGDYYAWSIYFGILWAVLIWALMRPGMIPIPALLIVVGFVSVILIGTNVVQNLNAGSNGNSIWDNLQVGIHEEITKALAVVAVIVVYEFLLHAPRLSIRGYMYLGALSGITFGVIESHTYLNNAYVAASNCITQNSGSQAIQHNAPLGPWDCLANVSPADILWRAITDGFTHALWASISAFFIGLAVLHRRWAIQFILTGLGIAIVLHGLNDWFASNNKSWLQAAVVVVSAIIVVGYAVSGNQIDRIIGQIEASNRPKPVGAGRQREWQR